MEPNKFDEIIKRASTTKLSRLDTLRGLAAGAVAAVVGTGIASTDADAKNKGKSGKKGKKGKKGNKGKNKQAVKGGGSVTTTTTSAQVTTTTSKQCKGTGYDCKGDCANKCCSGCGDSNGKCAPCPTTTTTSAQVTTTTEKSPICQHSNQNYPSKGCKNVCTSVCGDGSGNDCEAICGAQNACPVGQGGGNPCSSTAYCNPDNYEKDKYGVCRFDPS